MEFKCQCRRGLRSGARGLKFITLAAALCLTLPPQTRAASSPFVYETETEFLCAGDFNGDGVVDILVLDKGTGMARVGLRSQLDGTLTWSAAVSTGVETVTGCAVGRLLQSSRDALAVTSYVTGTVRHRNPSDPLTPSTVQTPSALNQVNLVDLSGANPTAAPVVLTPAGLGPHTLVALPSPLANGASTYDCLLTASSLNGPPSERLDLMGLNAGVLTSTRQFPETGEFDRGNGLTLGSTTPTYAAGLVRGETNDTFHLWQFVSPPGILLTNQLPGGSDYVFATFNGEPLPSFVFYVPGQSNLTLVALQATTGGFAFGPPQTILCSDAIQLVIDLGAGSGVMVQFAAAIQVLTLGPGGAASLGDRYASGMGTGGKRFTGAAPLGGGDFVLLDAPPGSSSTHAQVMSFDGSHFLPHSFSDLPVLTTRATRANVWVFSQEPFVRASPGFVASYNSPDWSDQVQIAGGSLSADAETDGGAIAGLTGRATQSLGTLPSGSGFGIPNQYRDCISLFSYAGPRPPALVTVTIAPPPGSYTPPVPVSLATGNAGDRAYFRASSAESWRAYTAPFPVAVSSTIQFYGVNAAGSTRSAIQFAAYSLGPATTPAAGGNPELTQTNAIPTTNSNFVQFWSGGVVYYGRRQHERGTIWAINLDGSGDTYLTTGARPRVSPDGRLLAFLRDSSPFANHGNLWLRDLASGGEWPLVVASNSIVAFNWMGDSASLVSDYGCQIERFGLDSSAASLLQGNCFQEPAVNASGGIAFQYVSTDGSGPAGVYVATTNLMPQPLITWVPNAAWPAWSPTGQQLALVDGSSGSPDAGHNLYLVEADGTGFRPLSLFTNATDQFPHGAVWTPEGNALVAAGTVCATNGLWLIPLTENGQDCACAPIRLPTSPGDPIDFAGSVIAAPAATMVRLTSKINYTATYTAATVSVAHSFPDRGPVALAAADLNGDGYLDLVTASEPTELTVMLNDGTGALVGAAPLEVAADPVAITVADLNGDGYPDLSCISSNHPPLNPFGVVSILTNNSGNHFVSLNPVSAGTGLPSTSVAVVAADLGGTGYPALIIANLQASNLIVLGADGRRDYASTGTFVVPLHGQPASVTAADLNGDGHPDLICADIDQNAIEVLLNDGHGQFPTFALIPVGPSPDCVLAADVNGDGFLDLICANKGDNTITVLLSDGQGNFTPALGSPFAVGQSPVCVVAADVNGDGATDLITANYNDDTLSVLTNNGRGGFALVSTLSTGHQPVAVLAADLARNGDVNLISANSGDHTVTIFSGAQAPVIVSSPGSPAVLAGATVSLRVHAVGTGPLSYRWSWNGIPLAADDAHRAGTGGNMLTLNHVTDADSGTYTVTIANLAGTATTTATLWVQAPPPLLFTNNPLFRLASAIYQGFDRSSVVVVAADVNGNGLLDLITANRQFNTLTVRTNDGLGNFMFSAELSVGPPFASASSPSALVAADLRRNGFPDLVCSDSQANTLVVFHNDGHGNFPGAALRLPVGSGPLSLVAADVNGDGLLDLISANAADNTLSVLLNQGDGTFAPGPGSPLPVGGQPRSVMAADLNGDGFVDLISANQADNTLTILLNDGQGNFSPSPNRSPVLVDSIYSNGVVAVAVGDLSGSGAPWLVAANAAYGTLTVLQNDGNGGVLPWPSLAVGSGPVSIAVRDLNGDGAPDLICANQNDNTLTVLTNDGAGNFVLASTLPVGSRPTSVIAADLDGNHTTDLVVANAGDDSLTIIRGRVPAPVPTVVTLPPNSVTTDSALGGASVNPGGAPTMVWFSFGPTTAYGLTNTLVGSAGGGWLPFNLFSYLQPLRPNTLYHYQAFASNAVGAASGGDVVFMTAPRAPVVNAAITQTNGSFQLEFNLDLGTSYTIQGSTNLLNWVDLTNFTATSDMGFRFVDRAVANYRGRFYRVRIP